MVEIGDLAAPGRPLLMVESKGTRRVALSVPESIMAGAALALGESLQVQVDNRPDLGRMDAAVVEMAPAADPASHSFLVELELPAAEVASGSAARAWVKTDSRQAVAVPAESILRRGGVTLVALRDASGHAGTRVVTLGESLETGKVEVLSGLEGGEELLLGLSAAPPAGAVVEAMQ